MRGFPWLIGIAPLMAGVTAVTAEGQVPGGWRTVSVRSPEVVAAAEYAIAARRRVAPRPDDGTGAQLELVEILAAEQQVVAGINYRLVFSVKQGGEPRAAEAIVWWQAWRNPEPYQLTSWTWRKADGH